MSGRVSGKVFVVDISRCTGCGACAVACKDRADLPDDVNWLRIEEREAGACPSTVISYRVVHCFHCAEPPCVEACPVEALARVADGLVALDAEACTDCGECVAACPFDAISTLPDGKPSKCDGCADETAGGLEPTCVRACPMLALAYLPPFKQPALSSAPLECAVLKDGPALQSAPLECAILNDRAVDAGFDERGTGPAVLYLRRAGRPTDGPCHFIEDVVE